MFKQNKFSKAEYIVRKLVEIDPNDSDVNCDLGAILSRQNKFDEAEKEYREAIRLNPNDTQAHNKLGYLTFRLDRKI